MTLRRSLLLSAAFVVSGAISCVTSAFAADAVLSGTITAAGGEKIGGVTVSAKPVGGTITTTVYTDEAGNYYFPPLPSGNYRVWAQAVGFETAKASVDLAAAKQAGLRAQGRREDFVKQLPGNAVLAALPEETPHDKLMKQIVRNNCTACHTASYVLQHHFDETGWNAIIELMKNVNVYGTYVGKERQPSGILDYHQKDLAAYLARARGPGESSMQLQARSAPVRRSGARRDQGIRRAARSGRRAAGELRAERRQRLVARHAVGADPGLGRARRLARSRRQCLVHLQHPEQAHHHRPRSTPRAAR